MTKETVKNNLSTDEVNLEEKLKDKLSKENIHRQVLATLLRGDSCEQLAGALYINNVLLNEAMELLAISQDRISENAQISTMYQYLFTETEHYRRLGLKTIKSLDAGRIIASNANKEKAAKNKAFILQINTDILNNPATSRKPIAWRAKEIRKICDEHNKKLANGNSYAESTIAKYIQGT